MLRSAQQNFYILLALKIGVYVKGRGFTIRQILDVYFIIRYPEQDEDTQFCVATVAIIPYLYQCLVSDLFFKSYLSAFNNL